ncbi:MAG TPA: MacB family efflux pump subunit [Candidatus Omnitrophica bacterium]|nr:MacB family efflux pump subunit [Candidatus Omnitrophota bacterium]
MIELKNIHKTYLMGNNEVSALAGVSLKISKGEFIAIMGPSGSGKSTLMHILGLLDRPDAGAYYFEGSDLTALSGGQLSVLRNRVVGFIFQQFHLLPRMSALENVMLPLIYGGKGHLKDTAKEKIALVGLSDRAAHRPNELSGGQQQRVAIARALVNDPRIILADEPTGNLDSKSQEEIMAILKRLNEEGKTVIIVTHEKEVASCAKRIIYVRDGKIISDETSVPYVENKIINTVSAPGISSQAAQGLGGMKLLDYVKQACIAMFSHPLRSILSILGILIGVAAVIAMLALGEGAKASIEKRLSSLGANLLVIRPGSAKIQGVALEAGAVTRFTMADLNAISSLSGVVKVVTPSVVGRAQLVYTDKNWNTQVEGTGVAYETIRAATPAAGRFFNEQELKAQEKVALLGPTVAKELFGENNPLGETVKINLINFKVIGVLPAKGASTWRDQDDTVVIPVTTAMNRLFGKDYYDTIYVEAVAPDLLEEAQEAISALIKRLHHLSKEQEDSFQIRNMADIRSALETTTKTMRILLGSIAAISLLVGGIGIMNIMLVAVTERTREIGLRKAIGAAESDILMQFLCESVLLSLIGGGLGIGLGFLIAMLMIAIAGWAIQVSLFSVLLASIFSFVVGVVFGLWPARQASRLDPIEALRYE